MHTDSVFKRLSCCVVLEDLVKGVDTMNKRTHSAESISVSFSIVSVYIKVCVYM